MHNDEEERKKYIIDGQQRTITSMIFVRSLQLFYENIYKIDDITEANYRVSDITTICIGRKDNLHLELGELDNDYFRDNIQLGIPGTKKEKKKSHERIRKAFVFFQERFKEEIDEIKDGHEKMEFLDGFYNAFTQRFNVLYMEATKLEEAFIIFETLNARGRELETADLLKNCIFSKSNDIDMAQKQWHSMLSQLDKVDPTKYIRHYWNSGNEFTRDKALYRKISKEITTPRASKELLSNLDKLAQSYHDMSDPNDNIGFSDEKLITSLQALKVLKASSFYPILLAMQQTETPFSEKDMAKVAEAIEVYVYRNSTICGKVANKAEVFFAEIARQIFNETFNTIEAIEDAIHKETVTDKEFQDGFAIWVGTKSSKDIIRYTLRRIHQHIDPYNEINIDNSEVHIEHIMPEDNSQWGINQEDHDTYLWRLGNLALISGKINISMSNKPFEEKKEQYAVSNIEPNKQISNCKTWDGNEIEKRQLELASYALEIWK